MGRGRRHRALDWLPTLAVSAQFSKEKYILDSSPEKLHKELEEELKLSSTDLRSHAWYHGRIPREVSGLGAGASSLDPSPTAQPAPAQRGSDLARGGFSHRGLLGWGLTMPFTDCATLNTSLDLSEPEFLHL